MVSSNSLTASSNSLTASSNSLMPSSYSLFSTSEISSMSGFSLCYTRGVSRELNLVSSIRMNSAASSAGSG